MGTALTKQNQNARAVSKIPSLPGWAESRRALLATTLQADPTTRKYRAVPTLPASAMLSQLERDEADRHLSSLRDFLGPTPLDDKRAEAETLVLITKMMLALPAQKTSATGAEAQGEAYQAAVDDLPPWAVAGAIRRWYRGECGHDNDYRWRPGPAQLRSIARGEMWEVTGQIRTLNELLRAEALIEYSEEYRGKMLTRLSDLFHGLTPGLRAPKPEAAE